MAFDLKAVAQTVFAGLVVALGAHYGIKWLDTPSGLSADVFPVPNYGLIPPTIKSDGIHLNDINGLLAKIPPAAQPEPAVRQRMIDRAATYDRASVLSQASCANIIRLTNNTTKVMKDVRVTAEHIAGFLAPTGERRAAMKPTFDHRLNLASIDPGDTLTVVAFTSYDCDNDYGGFSQIRAFTNETTAQIRTVLMPRGLMITLNHYWPLTYFMLAMGVFLFVASVINGVVELVKKSRDQHKKTDEAPTPMPADNAASAKSVQEI